eukprot:jgi/Mesen1/5625/ME000282S04769
MTTRFSDLKSRGLDLHSQVHGWAQDRWDGVRQLGHKLSKPDRKQADHLRVSDTKRQQFDRSFQFWTRAVGIYASYKVCQAREHLVKDPQAREQMWEAQHEYAADRLYSMCVDLGGFFLKSGQFLAKPDLVPMAWVRRLSVLHDAAPADPFPVVRGVLEAELGANLDTLFSSFCEVPVGSASIAQVHKARLRSTGADVAVKVQHRDAESLVMMDLANHHSFAGILQKLELKFDLQSVVKHEFDFVREAHSMDRIATSLALGGGSPRGARGNAARPPRLDMSKSPIIVPRSVPGLVTRRVLVMDYIDGVQIMRLGDAMKQRGISPTGRVAQMAKKNILRDLSAAYGHMILRDGHFQADPHPGNIFVCQGGKVALLDYGQTKELPDRLRLSYARLVLAICADDVDEIGRLFKEVGIQTEKTAQEDPDSFLRMSCMMFDTTMNSKYTTTNPFAEESSLRNNAVKAFPKDLFFVLRTVQLLRGLSMGMDCELSVAKEWKGLAQEALAKAK